MIRAVALAPLLLLATAPMSKPPRTGGWKVVVHPSAIQIPPQLEADSGPTLRAMMTKPETSQACLERVDLTRLQPVFAPVTAQQKSCTVTALTLNAGKVTGTAECKESGQPMTAAIAGRYTPTSFDATITRVTGGLDSAGTVAMTITAKRTGACQTKGARP